MLSFAAMYASGNGGDEQFVEEPPVSSPDRSEGTSLSEAARSRGMGSGRGKGRGNGNPERYDMTSQSGSQGDWSSSHEAEKDSERSWWSRASARENWSWAGSSDGWSAYGVANENWEPMRDGWHDWHHDRRRGHWEQPGRDDHGRVRGYDHGGAHGDGGLRRDPWEGNDHGREQGEASPLSVPAARDVSGTLPSGEVSSAGNTKEPKVAGDQKHSKVSSSYPPVFRAKPGESYKEWKRAVGFWLGGEANSLPPELIGPRLMVQLRDRAGQLVHHLSNDDVNKTNGMELIMATLEKSPIIRQLDKHKVDLHRKKLMQLKRLPNESVESYVTRGQIYRTQLLALDHEMQMGECFFTGHLLDGARLSRKDKIMIKTRAGTDYEEDVTNAMVELAPELEGEHGFPIGSSEPNAAARQGDEYLVQRSEAGRFRKEGRDTHGVDFDGPSNEGFWDLEEEDGTAELEENDPPELLQAAHEAYALQHKARQRIMEIKKLRQYYKKPDPEERRRALQEKMKTAPCHKCGQLGHWSRECPQKEHGVAATNGRPASGGASSVEEEWSAFVAMCHQQPPSRPTNRSYKGRAVWAVTHQRTKRSCGVSVSPMSYSEILWCQQELHLHVILDLGCVKSVVGLKWMKSLIQVWQENDRWFAVYPEKEKFQFGNGESLYSRFQVHFEAMIAGCHVVLAMSVVHGNCPPLMSRHACSKLGLKIDCSNHSFSSSIMGVKNYGVSQASNGHYLLPVSDFSTSPRTEIPEDFKMEEGCEAQVFQKAVATRDTTDASVCAIDMKLETTSNRTTPISDPSDPSVDDGVGVFSAQGSASPASDLQALRRSRSPYQRVPNAGTARGGRGGDRDASGHGVQGASSEGAQSGRRHSEDQSNYATPRREDPSQGREGDEGRLAWLAFDYGLGHGDGVDEGGGGDDQQETPEGCRGEDKGTGREGLDRGTGQLPDLVACMVVGGGDESGVLNRFEDEGVSMEETPLAAEGERCSGAHRQGDQMEAQPALVGNAVREGGGSTVGSLRVNAPASEQSGRLASDVKPKMLNMQRGEIQQVKQGVQRGLAVMEKVNDVVKKEGRYVLMEIYAGTARLTNLARTTYAKHWTALDPVDIIFGHDLSKKKTQDEIWQILVTEEPDLVTLSMPCGPWCQWMKLCDPEVVAEKQAADWPLWLFARRVWDFQVQRGALVLTENPLGSEGLKTDLMEDRPSKYRAKIAQCMFGLVDAVSGMPHRKLTALDVNDEDMAKYLEVRAQCNHEPGEHQLIEGTVSIDGQTWNRSTLAGAWPRALCDRILRAAHRTLQRIEAIEPWTLADPVSNARIWEAHVVRSGEVVEEGLRHHLQELGAGGNRYGYITFEGEGQQVPRRIRATLAHLHSALGHVANDRLVRMLLLSGAGEEILKAARNLRCQVCAMVQPPRDAPQVAYSKPKNFNERVSGDTFYVWDIKNVKFAVVHFLDDLTDFHVADCHKTMDSTFAAGVLRDQWYGVFGPPDVLVTDGGMEFAGAVETLNDLMGVVHDTIPEGAKWRLGHAERHGGILKLMLLKMLKGMTLDGLDDMRTAVTAACSAKNRLCNHGGVSPLQAVTGRNAVIPASLMTQICSGKMKFVLNQDMDREECLRRAERIRMGAIEAFHWLDSHTTLRRALASKSRPPRLEMLKEGTVVYIYDPPANRRGLARRLQDNVSWHGPAVVVCVERDKNVPKKIWVRLRGRVRAVPLEKVRLATAEELASGQFIQEALEEVQKELTSGKLRVPEEEKVAEDERPEGSLADEFPDDSEGTSLSTDEELGEEVDKPTERMALEKKLLDDVPLSFKRAADEAASSAQGRARAASDQEEPSSLPFAKKQKIYEEFSKKKRDKTKGDSTMHQARTRERLENAYEQLRAVRKTIKASKPRPKPTVESATRRKKPVQVVEVPMHRQGRAEAMRERADLRNFVEDALTEQAEQSETYIVDKAEIPEEHEVIEDEEVQRYHDRQNETYDLQEVIERMTNGTAEYGVHVTEVLQQHVLWVDAEETKREEEIKEKVKKHLEEENLLLDDACQETEGQVSILDQSTMLTGKQRLEYDWKHLADEWKEAFVEPIVKAFKVHFEHDALAGVPMGQFIDPKRILPSRLVLTNKGDKSLEGAELKARWVFGGHRDPDAGQYPTASPTVSLIGHNILNLIAVQKGWVVNYEDVSAAFLQGQNLPEGREIYVRIPHGYPEEAMKSLHQMIGQDKRPDVVRLLKGGFGLPESPRLWYLEYRQTLLGLGGRELKLLPGFFCFYNDEDQLIGMACIHVDDTRYAGGPEADEIWKKLHERLNFGKKRSATEGWIKFCGRFERQDPTTFEMEYSMDQYCHSIPVVHERSPGDWDRKLTDLERKAISSVIGQLAWAARQCRADLAYGCSHAQQLAGRGDAMALSWVNRVVRRARQSVQVTVKNLGCSLDEIVFLAISDAAYAAQPGGASQGGLIVAAANPNVQQAPSAVSILEAQSSRLQRVVRCSMSAELSMGATAYEHGDYLRAVVAEVLRPNFRLSQWKMFASQWRHILVMDAKVAYDALKSETAPTDRKLIVDIAVLREALEDSVNSGFVRWVPGREIPCDGLTKWYANGSLERLMTTGVWSLTDTETAAELRRQVAERKRKAKKAKL